MPADIDPSLRSGEPAMDRLDDGFSPPPQPQRQAAAPSHPQQPQSAERAPGPPSSF